MKVWTALGLAAVLLALPAAAETAKPSAAGLVDGLRCTPFEWVAVEGVSERAALRVPVRIEGREYAYQLDTGSPTTFIYGSEAFARGWAAEGDETARLRRIEIGGWKVPPARLRLMPKRDRPGGTLGLDLLMDRYTIIDYPRRRFCVVGRADLPSQLETRTRWVKASLHHGKLFVPMKIGERWTENVFFDTGASMFPLSVDLPLWKALTGKADTAQATTTLRVGSWGRQIPLAGAPTSEALQVAGVT
ncbi:MAG: hypothetical protein M3M95_01235, partial [Pseudomonadota bacterium]|nr:hypothetical protein [Pseudomonadota bacterium]